MDVLVNFLINLFVSQALLGAPSVAVEGAKWASDRASISRTADRPIEERFFEVMGRDLEFFGDGRR